MCILCPINTPYSTCSLILYNHNSYWKCSQDKRTFRNAQLRNLHKTASVPIKLDTANEPKLMLMTEGAVVYSAGIVLAIFFLPHLYQWEQPVL